MGMWTSNNRILDWTIDDIGSTCRNNVFQWSGLSNHIPGKCIGVFRLFQLAVRAFRIIITPKRRIHV